MIMTMGVALIINCYKYIQHSKKLHKLPPIRHNNVTREGKDPKIYRKQDQEFKENEPRNLKRMNPRI